MLWWFFFWYVINRFIFCLYSLDGTLNPVFAIRALVQCTDIIVESGIDPFVLANNLFAKEVISEDVYARVTGMPSRYSTVDCLRMILDYLKDHIRHDLNILMSFLDVLRDMDQDDLADVILTKYRSFGKFWLVFIIIR